MRTLQIHAKRFSYRVGERAVDEGEEQINESAEAENALVAFVTVERGDGEEEVAGASKEICEHAKKVGATTIVLYPYAHLSSSLEYPEKSKKILELLEKRLVGCTEKFIRAPFGWYKEFLLDSFGHPMAELSRSFGGGRDHLIMKLSKQVYEKLIGDYLPRFGLKIGEGHFSIEEPWNSMISSNLRMRGSFCLAETIEDLAEGCERGGLVKLIVRPGNAVFYDIATSVSVMPTGREFELMQIERRESVYYAENAEGNSIPLGFEAGGKNYLLTSAFVASMIVDRLQLLDGRSPIPPTLPITFSPYQAAILKIGDVSEEYLLEVRRQIEAAGLSRVYIDGSPRRLGEKLRDWGMKWTPLIFIVGEKEEEGGSVILRIRKTGVQIPVKREDIAERLKSYIEEEQMMRTPRENAE
ncbi:MAG TPA: hypothetical protein ENO36_02620 [Fervidicoccus fontis]|uniref:Threonine--tRNA ligase n=1 Tax=Fervidicoccus fontis TaxID=683846 RepID=A0A7C2YSB4_9CREN|nr:MAG: hypothetical protein C0179_04320 [Fervidicoccus sp.]HEU97734.1 hypothetical protein [Fervidicoccus fontis]